MGYDLYLELSKTLILLYPLYPILRLGKALRLGPAIYRFIADRRTKYFGICTTPSHYKNWKTKEGISSYNLKILPYILIHFFAFGLVFLISIPLPFMGWQGVSEKSIPVRVSNVYGLSAINVFNGIDLQSGENWFILEQEDGERAPIYFPDGRRDAYHRSDRFYFVVSNTYRRLAALENIQKGKLFCHIQDEVMQTYIIKMIRQHLNVSNYEGALIYRQFYKAVPQPSEISENKYIHRVPYEVCVVKINNG
ncbi:DUF393 domain-containing protein [Paracoccaceae bacterium]|nr:DUF393 domain-containing protein [Paracoccaceae bacterium]